jgi:hypothetical protein
VAAVANASAVHVSATAQTFLSVAVRFKSFLPLVQMLAA